MTLFGFPDLAREFRGYFDEIDLMQLPNYDIYISLMIDGAPSKLFIATALLRVGPSTD
jgi:hypothetical protein